MAAATGQCLMFHHMLQDEGVKECQHYIDLRGCNCELANIKGKPKGTIIRIQKPDGPSYLLQASDKVEFINAFLLVILSITYSVRCCDGLMLYKLLLLKSRLQGWPMLPREQ